MDTGFEFIIKINGHLFLLISDNNSVVILLNLEISTEISKYFYSVISSRTLCLHTTSNNRVCLCFGARRLPL
jgi:hypothetical protein